MPIRQTGSMLFPGSPSGYPGWPFPCNMAPGKEKKYRRGYRRSKNWAIIFPGTPGYPFRGERGAVFPKKYRLGIWRKKNPGAMWYPGFPENIRCMCVTKPGVSYYFGKLKFTIFYSLLCYKTNNNNVVLYYKRESNIEHARRYNETLEWFCRFR